jgi:hypothetical protein
MAVLMTSSIVSFAVSGARGAEAELRILGPNRPRDLAPALIERHELRVEPADEHLAVAERDAARGPAAAGSWSQTIGWKGLGSGRRLERGTPGSRTNAQQKARA